MDSGSAPTTAELLDMAQVRALTGYARSTIYDLIKKGRFPRPCSLPRARVKWRKSGIDAFIAKLREPPPEREEVRIARLNKLAHSPRRGEKRRGRPPASPPSRAAPPLAYMASPLDWAHEQALRRRFGLDQDDGPAANVKPLRSAIAT